MRVVAIFTSSVLITASIAFADIPSPNVDYCKEAGSAIGDGCQDSDGKSGTCQPAEDGSLFCDAKRVPATTPSVNTSASACNNLGTSTTTTLAFFSFSIGLWSCLRLRRRQD